MITTATMSIHSTGGEAATSLIPALTVPLVEREPSLIEVPLVGVLVEVDASTTPALPALREVKTLRPKAPVVLCPPGKTTAESSASWDKVISIQQETASRRKLSLSLGSLSSIGDIYVPDTERERDCELQGT